MAVTTGAAASAVARRVRLVRAGTGATLWVPEDTVSADAVGSTQATYTVKVSGEDTGGSLSVVEASIPPGSGPPPHVHPDADEAYFVQSGVLEVLDGEETLHVEAGDFVFIPKGTRHRFINRWTHPARLLFLFTPAGFERLFFEVGTPAVAGVPAPTVSPEDVVKAAAVAPKYFEPERHRER